MTGETHEDMKEAFAEGKQERQAKPSDKRLTSAGQTSDVRRAAFDVSPEATQRHRYSKRQRKDRLYCGRDHPTMRIEYALNRH